MSLQIISHLTETLSALVTSLKEKEAKNTNLKAELEKQKLQTEIENSDSKFFQESHKDEQEMRIEFQNKLKNQKDKLEKARESQRKLEVEQITLEEKHKETLLKRDEQHEAKVARKQFRLDSARNALKRAEEEKAILTSATPVAPKTHDVYIYVYRNGTVQAAESEKAAMEFFDDDFENYMDENDFSELKEKKERSRAVKDLAKSGQSDLDGTGIILKRVTISFECKEEVDSELENARKAETEKKVDEGEEIKATRKLPLWMKEGVSVRYLERNRIITNIVRNRIELDSRIWVNSTEIEKA